MYRVLVVDDQGAVRTALEVLFEVHGLPTLSASSPEEALSLVRSEDVGVVVQDMNFRRGETSGQEGAELMRSIRALDPDLPIVLMTAYTSLEMAVKLVKEGASDYIAKPWDDEKLVTTVRNLLRMRALAHDNERMRARAARSRKDLEERFDLVGLVYASEAMHEVVSLAVRVAASDAPVLVLGPNGSGKERIAAIIQANSRRKTKPFVKVNAGGLPDELLEAELFGAEAGAYTGASRTRIGRFEEANGGTIFLDEIGNLSPTGQMKLLRVLQTGEFQRLGSNHARQTDVRVVSATNADLRAMIAQGSFREDLFFRLNVIELVIPPLAERPDDIRPLAEHFLAQRSAEAAETLSFSDEAIVALLEHDYSGHVRELENRIHRASLVRAGPIITAHDLGLGPRDKRASRSDRAESKSAPPARPSTPAAAPGGGDEREREELERALEEAQGVVSRAAAKLGLSRQALYRRMERLGLGIERRLKS
jgi:DNA-binding NtrC family response regulator